MSSPSRPVVAITGATGHLGRHIAAAFLSAPFRDQFADIILLSRQESSQNSNDKFVTRKYDDNNLAEALKGVQVLVNTVGPSGHAFKDKLARALPQTDVQVYFPSEFGVDHYVHDFSHLEWDQKKKHMALAKQLNPDVKICRVFAGLFLEDSVGPWFGFNTKDGQYECIGSSQSPVSFTSLDDVGKTVASLAALPREKIPDTVHLAGDTRSFDEIAGIMQTAGAGSIVVSEVELKKYKEETTSELSWEPSIYLRFLMGEGKINHTARGLGSSNELVNPNQKLWRWVTLSDLAKENKGRPWKDFPWPLQ
ncbi:hypothetical protein N7466_004005 [Penicillium verhagenii]|uniref:uncharacterized protein n=1 Tax=Penicillium verhagenii TaxID=1562060 RepID=UPI002544D46F|nr:uncharacterized protein N7466_004005 [Penicillium verhagenii]KAJ5934458.1 hypothetical protein N7466_004005 [Penicillium verhagenii]